MVASMSDSIVLDKDAFASVTLGVEPLSVYIGESRQIHDGITTPTKEVAALVVPGRAVASVLTQVADESAAVVAGAPRSYGDRPDRGSTDVHVVR